MNGINHVFLVGHVGHDPELRTTANGRTMCKLRLATNRNTRVGEEWHQTTDWHRVTFWEKNAEIAAKFARKGRPIGVEGELRINSWTDASGQRRFQTEIHGRRLHLLGRNPTAEDTAAPPSPPAPMNHAPASEQTIPF